MFREVEKNLKRPEETYIDTKNCTEMQAIQAVDQKRYLIIFVP